MPIIKCSKCGAEYDSISDFHDCKDNVKNSEQDNIDQKASKKKHPTVETNQNDLSLPFEMIGDWTVKNWRRASILILAVLFLGNAFYTLSGFVAYTETERRGCDLLREIHESQNNEQRNEKFRNLRSENNKEIVLRYLDQFRAKGERCKSAQQFYLEQGLVVLLGALIIFREKIFLNNIEKK